MIEPTPRAFAQHRRDRPPSSCRSAAARRGPQSGGSGIAAARRDTGSLERSRITRPVIGLLERPREVRARCASQRMPRARRPSAPGHRRRPGRCRSARCANRCWQLSRILLEHRLGVGDRAADHLQHLGGRRLLLQRLLGLVEQAHVLDRDHGLVGEGLHQADLGSAERPHLRCAAARSRRSTDPRAASAPPARCESHCAPAARARRGTRCRSAAATSSTCTQRRSRNARPPTELGRSGSSSPCESSS